MAQSDNVTARSLLTAAILQRELQRITVRNLTIEPYVDETKMLGSVQIGSRVVCFDFPSVDLALSLDEFAAKHLYPVIGANQ